MGLSTRFPITFFPDKEYKSIPPNELPRGIGELAGKKTPLIKVGKFV